MLLLARFALPLWLGPPACLTADSLDPATGQGASAVFEAVYGHCEGATTFRVVQLWIGDEVSPSVDRMNLGYEDGVFFIEDGGMCAPGDPVVLHSTMGALDCAASSVMLSGNQAIVRWAIDFDTAAFSGVHGVFFDAKGGVGDPEPRLGWTQMGMFVVEDVAGETGSETSGGASTSEGSESTASDDASTDTDASSGAATDGSIPGGGVTDRGAADGCACDVRRDDADAWWVASLAFLVLAMRRRRA